jgi:hypothetical protein
VITIDSWEARSVYATDLDGDGDADVLSASQADDKIAWYENLGGGNFGSQQVITTSADRAWSVYATDLDGDGDADVLSASFFDDKIAWYENLVCANCSPGAPFCLGDGTGTPCPCGNTGAAGEGCANDTGSGAILATSGSNSVLADDLTLQASGLTPGPGLYFQGNNAINSGNGNPFGDGLRCAGNQVVRLEVQFSSAGSSATTISIATKGGVSAGDTKRYQHWYRDSGTSPCNSLFNLTNGYELTWTP